MRRTLLGLAAFSLLIPLWVGTGCADKKKLLGRGEPGDEGASLRRCREGMERIIVHVGGRSFRTEGLLQAEDREDLKNSWKSFLDYVLALDHLGVRSHEMALITSNTFWMGELQALYYSTFLTQYRLSLEFLDATDGIPGADTLLNEAMPEWGIGQGAFYSFKFRFLNLAQASKFMAFQAAGSWKGSTQDGVLRASIAEDEKALLALGAGKGSAMTLGNGLKILGQGIFHAWFPAQKGVAEWMGDTKVWRVKHLSHLITPQQGRALSEKLEPGDIFFTRHEWYLSNLGLPGFWSHAALYIGTPEARRAYFEDPAVKAWVKEQGGKGGFEELLSQKFRGSPPEQVLEAVSEGVVFSPLERFAEADSLVALRPRLSKLEKAKALFRAYSFAGRPYDFNFDFRSDDTLVCSELVYKAYEPATGFHGLRFPLQQMAGRMVSSPNGMVEQFDSQYGTKDQQTDLAVFLDGHEKEQKAVEAGVKELRQSWKRPKWNVFLQ